MTALANGHYVVSSPDWTNGTVRYAGAATWGNGTTGITGTVSAANSLVGSILTDDVSSGGVTALTNGHYVVLSDVWNNGAAANVGAVTWGDGATGITGTITAANSLVGSTAEDQIGSGGVTALSNGTYVVNSLNWDNGTIGEAGAITWGSKWTGMAGPLTAQNSVLGVTSFGGAGGLTIWAYDAAHGQLVVGRRYDNIVILFRPFRSVFLPLTVRDGP